MKRADDLQVHLNAAQNCYEALVQNQRCFADYVLVDNRVVFTHTFVPAELRGQGIAAQIVRFALADARSKGLKVTPACSYVARFIERHPEFQDLLA